MIKYFRKTYHKKIRDYSDVNYQIIDVAPGECHYNYKCHMNAVHIAWRDEHPQIAMVTYRAKGTMRPCVHFVNFVDGKFIDNTIGEWSRRYEYRLMRMVSDAEFEDVDTLLGDAKTFFRNLSSPLERLFGVVEDI